MAKLDILGTGSIAHSAKNEIMQEKRDYIIAINSHHTAPREKL